MAFLLHDIFGQLKVSAYSVVLKRIWNQVHTQQGNGHN